MKNSKRYFLLEELVAERTRALLEANAGLQQEIQGRKRVEESLRRSEERYRLIIESAADYAIFTLDTQWRVTSWNSGAQHLLLYHEDQILGRGMDLIFTENDRQLGVPQADMRKVQAAGRSRNERWYRRRDGSLFWAVGILAAQHDGEGRLIGYVKILQDISERKRAEEELERRVEERTVLLRDSYHEMESLNIRLEASNRELQDFAFVASHDLQEPLRKILAFGECLANEYQDRLNETGADYLRRMQTAACRMQTLINDLLQLSQVTSKAQEFVPVDLGQVVEDVLADMEVRIRQNGARVEVGPLPTIEADPTQMRQLLQNLIGNAIKFSRPGEPPRVRVGSEEPAEAGTPEPEPAESVTPEPETVPSIKNQKSKIKNSRAVTLYVADNGIGFDEKYLDRIFTVFQRLNSRDRYEGNGIGLAICRKIAMRHGGSITAHSQLGQGTTFRVTLPLKQTHKESF